jgi:hypothetical protein
VFRINVVAIWLTCNVLYVIVIQEAFNTPKNLANNGVLYNIDYIGIFMAAMCLFRLFFGLAYLFRFKCKISCDKKYEIKERDLLKEFKKMKKAGEANLEDSGMLSESLMKNDNADKEDDDLIATLSPLEMKMKLQQL